jgi:hypothetical protein
MDLLSAVGTAGPIAAVKSKGAHCDVIASRLHYSLFKYACTLIY